MGEGREERQGTLHIRDARADEGPLLHSIAAAEGMGEVHDFGGTLVAEECGRVIGLCRVVVRNGEPYVSPIVTVPEIRGKGVGTALMRAAFERSGPLKFVARGYAVPFYRSLGCTDIGWGQVAEEVADDCVSCERRSTCHPRPMRYDG